MWQYDKSRIGHREQIRVRVDHGHEIFYRKLSKDKQIVSEEIEKLEKDSNRNKTELNRKKVILSSLETQLFQLRTIHKKGPGEEFTLPRHSVYVETETQAKYVDRIFREYAAFEAEGREIPEALKETYEGIKKAPPLKEYLEDISESLAAISIYDVETIKNYPEDQYLELILKKGDYLQYHGITYPDIVAKAVELVLNPVSVDLRGKKVIFTGAFTSFTAISDFVKCLDKIAEHEKIDAIITAGPWEKTIFLNKSSSVSRVKKEVEKLIKKYKIYALRSNQDSSVVVSKLKEMGVTFVNKIEDEKNIFSNYKLSHVSSKDQLSRFRDMGIPKNIFTYTSYVAFETHLNNDEIYYIVGSGSSSLNLGRSQPWVISFDSQTMNSDKYDSTGGHVLTFDENLNVNCASFHYNRDIDGSGILLNGRVFRPNKKVVRCDLHVVTSDIHISHMNKYCFQGFLDFIEKERDGIKTLVINGDFFDNCVLSHWDEQRINEQIKNKLEIISFMHEVARARVALQDIVKRLNPKTKLIYKMGNHEVNSLKKILGKSLLHFLDNVLDLTTLLDLDNLGFEVIDSRKSFKVSGIPFLHGHEKNPAKVRKEHSRKNVIGHFHRCSIDNDGVCVPGMQDSSKADYMPYYKQNWKNGWAVLHEFEGIGEKPQLMLISEDNEYYDFDSKVTVKNKYDAPLPREINLSILLKKNVDLS